MDQVKKEKKKSRKRRHKRACMGRSEEIDRQTKTTAYATVQIFAHRTRGGLFLHGKRVSPRYPTWQRFFCNNGTFILSSDRQCSCVGYRTHRCTYRSSQRFPVVLHVVDARKHIPAVRTYSFSLVCSGAPIPSDSHFLTRVGLRSSTSRVGGMIRPAGGIIRNRLGKAQEEEVKWTVVSGATAKNESWTGWMHGEAYWTRSAIGRESSSDKPVWGLSIWILVSVSIEERALD